MMPPRDLAGNEFPPHLDGSMPGDAGFDPLSLGSDPTLLKWCAFGYIAIRVACGETGWMVNTHTRQPGTRCLGHACHAVAIRCNALFFIERVLAEGSTVCVKR